ncbi:Aste57867_10387 [Aphanomyces stellatus]|uniref:Aste57867_10387 protein n=1 Tax=Aphanomyces stellatus TaxID=120398 RepID=A0A485KQV7_9STRA|nr:hypothetical protein As57867_010347 [Aphanomyces stellatus]VFT87261.1 Aste57867_10387 [Aphanomyces stellatus]
MRVSSVGVLVGLAGTLAENACPYADMPTTINRIFTYNDCPKTLCIVNRSCAVVGDKAGWYDALGNFSMVKSNAWDFDGIWIAGNPEPNWTMPVVDVSKLALPASVTLIKWSTLAFQGISSSGWSTNVSMLELRNISSIRSLVLPPTLTSLAILDATIPTSFSFEALPNLVNLTFRNNDVSEIPDLPDRIKYLTLRNTTLKKFPVLPRGLVSLIFENSALSSLNVLKNIPSGVTELSIRFNTYEELSNLNFTQMSRLSIDEMPKLTRLINVSFSDKISFLGMTKLNVSFWLLSNSTFNVLDNLPPIQPPKMMGYASDGLSITSNPDECGMNGGSIQPLWEKFRSFREIGTEKTKIYTVCVLKDHTKIPLQPTTTIPSFSPSDSSLGTGAIVGISLGGGFLCALGLFFVFRCRQTKPSDTTDPYTKMQSNSGDSTEDDTMLDMQDLKLCRLDKSSLQMQAILGSGAFGDVWLGLYDGEPVAVKTLRNGNVSVKQVQSFINEIKLMRTFESPYIVKLIGAVWTKPSNVRCVMEYMDCGDLRQYLERHSTEAYPWVEKIDHIQDILQGLVYLHSLDIIHRDIKARNVLLDSRNGVKLTDFGVSKEDVQATMTMGVGTFRWMAPEVIGEQGYNSSADIYSFGMLLVEFDSHEIPYKSLKNPKSGESVSDASIITKVCNGSLVPTFSNQCPPFIREIAMKCLAYNANERPSAMQLAHQIKEYTKSNIPSSKQSYEKSISDIGFLV